MSRGPTSRDYAVLGLRPGAGEEEIRAAYRRLVKIHHPDRNPGDPAALATFRTLSESYAVLRSAGRRPGTAAGPGRSSAPRRTPTAPTAMVDLPVGEATWVAPDAILVGPGRAAALRPGATGSPFPSAERVIRVERRPDGHHVFMPPQPSARWPLSEAADTEGVAVAALWVGDRQDQGGQPAARARMPVRLMTGTVAQLAVDDGGWMAVEALEVDRQGTWTLDPAEPLSRTPHPALPVRVFRDAGGFHVRADLPAEAWARAADGPAVGAGRLGVATAELGGIPER